MASCAEKPYPQFAALLTPELRAKLSILPEIDRAQLLRALALILLVKDRPVSAT